MINVVSAGFKTGNHLDYGGKSLKTHGLKPVLTVEFP